MTSTALGGHCRRCPRGPLVARGTKRQPDDVEHGGRGLCRACYQWAVDHFRLEDYPRHNARAMDRQVVIERYTKLRDQGRSMAEIADEIGIERTALYGALARDRIRPVSRLDTPELARLRRAVGLPATLDDTKTGASSPLRRPVPTSSPAEVTTKGNVNA